MELSDLPEFAHFENSFVAFIDILGFTERVREIRNEEDFQRVSRVLYILKKEAESYASANDRILAYLQMTAISDSVIISIPYRSPIAAYLMVTIVHKLKYDLLALEPLRTLIRGYIDNGPVYH